MGYKEKGLFLTDNEESLCTNGYAQKFCATTIESMGLPSDEKLIQSVVVADQRLETLSEGVKNGHNGWSLTMAEALMAFKLIGIRLCELDYSPSLILPIYKNLFYDRYYNSQFVWPHTKSSLSQLAIGLFGECKTLTSAMCAFGSENVFIPQLLDGVRGSLYRADLLIVMGRKEHHIEVKTGFKLNEQHIIRGNRTTRDRVDEVEQLISRFYTGKSAMQQLGQWRGMRERVRQINRESEDRSIIAFPWYALVNCSGELLDLSPIVNFSYLYN